MIKYKVFFKADVFDPVNRVTTSRDFNCSIILHESDYPNGTHLSDIALEHAWYKIYDHFCNSRAIPLSIKMEYVQEVERYV